MKELWKEHRKMILLSLTAMILTIFSLLLFRQNTVCVYQIQDEGYEEEIRVFIKFNSKMTIERNYRSINNDILNEEMNQNQKEGYEITQKEGSFTATKKEKAKDGYYKTIRNYQKSGYQCRVNL